MISIDFGGLYADIERYAQRLENASREATERAAERLQTLARYRARQDERWANLADDIHVWSQDGMLVIGTLNNERVSEVMLLEYGDEVTPPSPLFRSMGSEIRAAQQQVSDEVSAEMG